MIYKNVVKVKRFFLENMLDNLTDVWEYVRGLNPHDNINWASYCYLIAQAGTREEEDLFLMPATRDMCEYVRKNKRTFNRIKKMVGNH